MRWTYDPDVDALTIVLGARRRSTRTEELGNGLLVDFDRQGTVIAIEVLDASQRYPKDQLAALPLPVPLLPLSHAADRAGVTPDTLRQQIRNQRLKAIKRHREWWVAPAELERYLASRGQRGRRRAPTP
jgi:uncharacterized protein YuzE